MIALQVLAYQPEVVSFLVNGRHLPVDARALKSGLTPLLAMACARCTCNNASFCQAPVQVWGVQISLEEDDAHKPLARHGCKPMMGMLKLLLKLGANPGACSAAGCNMLEVAAEAGQNGMWDSLMLRPERVQRCPVHAGRILLSAMRYALKTSDFSQVGKVVTDLQSWYREKGRMKDFQHHISERFSRQANGGCAQSNNGLQLSFTSQSSDSTAAVSAMAVLIEAGWPLQSLLTGKKKRYELQESGGNMTMLAKLLDILRQKGEVKEHGRVLMGLLTDCCLRECNSDQLAALLTLLQQHGVDFRQSVWWPQLSSAAAEGQGLISPMSFACGLGHISAVAGFQSALKQLADTAEGGSSSVATTAFVYAATLGNADACSLLLRYGTVDVLPVDAVTGQSCVWAAFVSPSWLQVC